MTEIKKRKSRAIPKENHKKPGPAPVVFSDDQIAELQTLAAVLNKEQLADYFGVSHVTLKAIEDRQPDVSFAYKKGKAKAIANIAGNLISKASSGNIPAQIFYLKTQAGWKETVRTENETLEVKTFGDMYNDNKT